MSELTARWSTRLMEEHRMGTSIKPDTEFLASRGPAGELDLFYVGQGKQNAQAVHNLQRDPASETGWRHTDLGNAFPAGGVASGLSPEDGDTQIVFAFEDNDYGISLYWVREDEPGKWDDWRFLSTEVIGAPSNRRVKAIRAEPIDGKLYLFAVLGVTPGAPFHPDEVWSVPWNDLEGCHCLGEVSSDFMKFVNVKNLGEGLLVTNLPQKGTTGEDLIFVKPGDSAVRERLAANVPTALLAIEEQIGGCSVIFLRADPVREKSQAVNYIDCATEDRTVRPIDGTERIVPKQLLPVDAEAMPLTLYLLDEQNRLFTTKRQASQASGELEWMPPLPLGFAFSYVAGGLNEDGYAQVFGLSAKPGAENRLECIFKSPPIEGEEMAPGWQWTTVDVPVETLESLPVYGTELTVCDAEHRPLSETEIWISATELVDVEINYRHEYLGTRRWLPVTTDRAGRVSFLARTRSLDGPKWLVSRSIGEGGVSTVSAAAADLSVAAAENTVARMKTMGVDDVRGVLPPETRDEAEEIHKIIGQLMDYHSAVGEADSGTIYSRLDPTRLPQGAWRLSIEGGHVSMRAMSEDDFDAFRAWAEASPDGIFNDLLEWFTDAAESIANGVAETVDYAFNTGKKGLEAVIRMVVDGITYVFQGVIKCAEQVVQIGESVFNAAKAYFTDLFTKFFGLILKPFLKDVRAAAGFMEDRFESLLTNLINTVEKAKPGVEDFFEEQRSELRAGLDRLLEALGNETADYRQLHTTGALGALPAGMDGDQIVDTAQGLAVFSGSFLRKARSPAADQPTSPFEPTEEVKKAVETFVTEIAADLSDDFADQIDALQQFLQTTFETPEKFLTAGLKLIVETVRNALDLALGFGQAIALGLLDVLEIVLKGFRQMVFETPIGNSLLQELYKLAYPDAKPEELTLGHLFFLLVGAPVALGWRALFRRPFGDLERGEPLPLYGPRAFAVDAPAVDLARREFRDE